jgi:hypothetical protein
MAGNEQRRAGGGHGRCRSRPVDGKQVWFELAAA